MMAKMKYSEIPRDMSSDSVAALRLAQGSPDRESWRSYRADQSLVSPDSKPPLSGVSGESPSHRLFHPPNRRSTSAFRSHCLGRKESPEPDGSLDDMFIPSRLQVSSAEKDLKFRRGPSPAPYVLQQFNSLPRSTALKSSSLPASARSGLSAMLCLDNSTNPERSPSPCIDQISQVNPETLAAQLTLLDMPVFKSIQPEELSSCGWTKKNKLEVSPNVVAMTRRFNQVIFWTVEEILQKDSTVRQRAEIIVHFIRIARKLHEINNLHSLFAIISALRSASIFRLKKTWSAVPKKDIQHFDRLADLFSDNNNWERLRQHMNTLKLPCVPYLGLFLTDLIFIDMAHPHYGGLESQQRQLKMNNILRIVSNYQQSDYSFLQIKKSVMEYLRQARYIEELQKLVEDDHFKLSLKLEPQSPPSSSTSSKESFYDVNNAVGQLNLSPTKSTSSKSTTDSGTGSGGGKFVPGHHKSRSLGTKLRSASLPRSAFRPPYSLAPAPSARCDSSIFRNVQYPSTRMKQCGSQSCITSVANQGFDSTLRNLIDDSVQEENCLGQMRQDPTHSVFPSDFNGLEADQSAAKDKGSTHSLSGLDSPLPPPPIRCCCIQGCVRKKTILKDGRRPAVSSWQRFWIQVSGSRLVFYSPKSLRGSDRSDFRRDPYKIISISGWIIRQHDSPHRHDSIYLINPVKHDEYKFRIVCANALPDWLFYLSVAAHTETDTHDPGNLMSFE